MMFTEDYLMRIINQALAALMTAIGLRKKGKYSEALQAVEGAIGQLTTLPASLIDQMEDAGILSMLTVQEKLDVGRLALLADLYQEKGEIFAAMDRPAQTAMAFSRALRFDLEVALAETGDLAAENILKIESLYRRLRGQSIPLETQLALSDYYQRLLDLDDRTLSAAHISRPQAQKELARLHDQLGSSQITLGN
jgi:tetratricopeptide (TPR) repeat protein